MRPYKRLFQESKVEVDVYGLFDKPQKIKIQYKAIQGNDKPTYITNYQVVREDPNGDIWAKVKGYSMFWMYPYTGVMSKPKKKVYKEFITQHTEQRLIRKDELKEGYISLTIYGIAWNIDRKNDLSFKSNFEI
jgi:hypothetical protein